MIEQLKQAQQKMEAMKQRLDNITVSGSVEGGKINVELTASRKIKNIHIADELMQDKDELIDLLSIALNRALDSADKANEAEQSAAAREMMGNMGGLASLFGKK